MTFSIEKERLTAVSSDSRPAGFVSFSQIRPDLVNIDNIIVYPDFRNQDLEDRMMEALLPHLERQHQKAALTCPKAQQYVRSHPQWRHILPGEMHFTTH